MKKFTSAVLLIAVLFVSMSGCFNIRLPAFGKVEEQKQQTLPTETETPTQSVEVPIQTTQAPVEETQAPVSRDMLPDGEIQKRINLFLSNFAEQHFDAYPTTDYNLLRFARSFSKVNNRDLIQYKDMYEYMTQSSVDAVLNQYFGVSVTPGSDPATYLDPGISNSIYDEIRYENGAYYFHAADGGFYGYVTVVDQMVDNGNGTYDVTFRVYSCDFEVYAEGGMSRYYTMTAQEASADSTLTLYRQGTATVKDYTRANGVESYQLIQYNTYN